MSQVASASRKFCAYHWSNGSKIYAYQPNLASLAIGCGGGTTPNGGVDNTLTATSHEQFEAYTDPFGDGWYDDVDADGIYGDAWGELRAVFPLADFQQAAVDHGEDFYCEEG